jgi:hypothetical protein
MFTPDCRRPAPAMFTDRDVVIRDLTLMWFFSLCSGILTTGADNWGDVI